MSVSTLNKKQPSANEFKVNFSFVFVCHLMYSQQHAVLNFLI